MKKKNLLLNEDAIVHEEDDLLNYYPFAEKVKEIIQGYSSNSNPLTIGIYGKWGSGKTSFLNLIEKNIEIFQKDIDDKPFVKFHYNPWIYQDKEEMLFDFFETLSKKLNIQTNERLKKAGKIIKKYSRYLKSIKISTSIGVPKVLGTKVSFEPYEILKALGEDLEENHATLFDIKKDIDLELEIAKRKIIIFIDDVDRLDKDEIYTLFKLIKIIADFKNLVFIISMDYNHVSNAIYKRYGDNVKSGRDFLEKIINIPLELPLIEREDLDFFLKEKIKRIIDGYYLETEQINALFNSIDGKYFYSPREVIRVINSFSISLYAIGEEVNLHDLFWIEYLKIKHPTAYEKIKNYVKNHKLESTYRNCIDFNKMMIEDNKENGLRKILKEKHEDAFEIIEFLFPMKKNGTYSAYENISPKPDEILDRELRINHINHLEKYFSYHTKGKISEVKYAHYKRLIHEEQNHLAIKELDVFLNEVKERKVVYRIISDLEYQTTDRDELNDKKKHIVFLFENLSSFIEDGRLPHSIEIIRVASEVSKRVFDENNTFISTLISKLDIEQLVQFTIMHYEDNTDKLSFLGEELIKKVKESGNVSEWLIYKFKNISV